MTDKIVFRDLPGIADLEARYIQQVDGKLFADEIAALDRDLDLKSLELFGITREDTGYYSLSFDERPASYEDWEQNFEFMFDHWEEEDAFWNAFGIDLDDEEGNYLISYWQFGRQLVCALRQLHPKATLTFLPSRLTWKQIEAAAEAWGRAMLARKA